MGVVMKKEKEIPLKDLPWRQRMVEMEKRKKNLEMRYSANDMVEIISTTGSIKIKSRS
jgi:hypothetical protein